MSVRLQKRFLDVIALAGECSAACEASFSGFLLSSNAEPAVLHLRSPSALLLAPRRLPGRPPANKFDQALRQRAFILKGCCYGNGISTIQDQMLALRLTAGWSVLGQCKASIKVARTPECKVKLQAEETQCSKYMIIFSQRSNHDPMPSPITCSLRIVVLHGLRGQ